MWTEQPTNNNVIGDVANDASSYRNYYVRKFKNHNSISHFNVIFDKI